MQIHRTSGYIMPRVLHSRGDSGHPALLALCIHPATKNTNILCSTYSECMHMVISFFLVFPAFLHRFFRQTLADRWSMEFKISRARLTLPPSFQLTTTDKIRSSSMCLPPRSGRWKSDLFVRACAYFCEIVVNARVILVLAPAPYLLLCGGGEERVWGIGLTERGRSAEFETSSLVELSSSMVTSWLKVTNCILTPAPTFQLALRAVNLSSPPPHNKRKGAGPAGAETWFASALL